MANSPVFDMASWKRASKTAVRVFAYITVFYILAIIVSYIVNLIVYIVSQDQSVAKTIASMFSAVIWVFGTIASFFKVLDEDRPGNIQLIG